MIRKLFIDIRDKILPRHQKEDDLDLSGQYSMLKPVTGFRESSLWFYKFMGRNKFTSMNPSGYNGFLDDAGIFLHQELLRSFICMCNFIDISNTDEVVVLYRSFPIRKVYTKDAPTAYKRVKDSLSTVLTVFLSGDKSPLLIIGNFNRPKCFPLRFDPLFSLRVFYFSQNNSWNIKSVRNNQVHELNRSFKQQGRKGLYIPYNCSSDSI